PAVHVDLHSFPTRRSSDLRLRHMVDDVEHFVLSALSDFIPADSGGNPPIFADLTATLPNLTESIVLTVWLLLRGPALEVQVLRRSEEHTSELQSRENLVCR